jgi:hypothetical protein
MPHTYSIPLSRKKENYSRKMRAEPNNTKYISNPTDSVGFFCMNRVGLTNRKIYEDTRWPSKPFLNARKGLLEGMWWEWNWSKGDDSSRLSEANHEAPFGRKRAYALPSVRGFGLVWPRAREMCPTESKKFTKTSGLTGSSLSQPSNRQPIPSVVHVYDTEPIAKK